MFPTFYAQSGQVIWSGSKRPLDDAQIARAITILAGDAMAAATAAASAHFRAALSLHRELIEASCKAGEQCRAADGLHELKQQGIAA